MPDNKAHLLEVLQKELGFLESGGYRDPDRWGQSLIFEDSHTCTHRSGPPAEQCPECPLMTFVPIGRRHTPIPCRHIPLNEEGYTLDNMYRWNSSQEIEETVKQWLKKKIAQLESSTSAEKTPA